MSTTPDPNIDEPRAPVRLRDGYGPGPLSTMRRAEMLVAVHARVGGRARWRLVGAGLVAAAAVAAAGLWLARPAEYQPGIVLASKPSPAASWEERVLLGDKGGATEVEDEPGYLPDEYLAIADIFLRP